MNLTILYKIMSLSFKIAETLNQPSKKMRYLSCLAFAIASFSLPAFAYTTKGYAVAARNTKTDKVDYINIVLPTYKVGFDGLPDSGSDILPAEDTITATVTDTYSTILGKNCTFTIFPRTDDHHAQVIQVLQDENFVMNVTFNRLQYDIVDQIVKGVGAFYDAENAQ
ncbi:hypothetical protein DM01DRAFT_326967 [Hesseltinella vesiculosa]|uniref:Uncharacterized protein n=1 Tax=Hesseltinella vesiculosa TaxID=101127 RepID=A0A1X2GUZ1_9FUNG|nr:hypothetical protein DM01DRAFT_326967 [Hesseltinella vesiculosa]